MYPLIYTYDLCYYDNFYVFNTHCLIKYTCKIVHFLLNTKFSL
jgi:hypothetical protein